MVQLLFPLVLATLNFVEVGFQLVSKVFDVVLLALVVPAGDEVVLQKLSRLRPPRLAW